MSILILSSTRPRHTYFVNELLKVFPDSKVVLETNYNRSKKYNYQVPEPTIAEHFSEFVETEKAFFGKEKENKKNVIGRVEFGKINEATEVVKEYNPEIVAVHATSLIGKELIDAFPQKIINFHSGLSPYYRGGGCNVFPFLNKDLEHVGVTIHYLDEGIDTGRIILQGRPIFEKGDNTHTIGCKCVKLGTELMLRVLSFQRAFGACPSHEQDKSKGKLYLRKHFTAEVVKGIRKNLDEGIVEKYIKNPVTVDLVERIK